MTQPSKLLTSLLCLCAFALYAPLATAQAPTGQVRDESPDTEPPAHGEDELPPRPLSMVYDDVVITAQVKSALIAAEDVDAFEVNVDTRRGVVELAGNVASQAELQAAERIAREVGGVREVVNNLTVE